MTKLPEELHHILGEVAHPSPAFCGFGELGSYVVGLIDNHAKTDASVKWHSAPHEVYSPVTSQTDLDDTNTHVCKTWANSDSTVFLRIQQILDFLWGISKTAALSWIIKSSAKVIKIESTKRFLKYLPGDSALYTSSIDSGSSLASACSMGRI